MQKAFRISRLETITNWINKAFRLSPHLYLSEDVRVYSSPFIPHETNLTSKNEQMIYNEDIQKMRIVVQKCYSPVKKCLSS